MQFWFFKQATKALISLRSCAGWSGHSLPAYVMKALFSSWVTFVYRHHAKASKQWNSVKAQRVKKTKFAYNLCQLLSTMSASLVVIMWQSESRWLRYSRRGWYVRVLDRSITKTRLYNFDPLKPHFYIVKLGFTGVCIIFLISAQNIDCGYPLEPPRRGGSNGYPQSIFYAEIWKISDFFIWKFSIFGGEIFYIFE